MKPKYSVKVELRFRSGHRLLPPYKGHCNNPHGEGYTAILIFEKNKLDENGMVFDFGTIKRQIKNWIDENWDHAYIYNKKDEVGEYLNKKGFKTFKLDTNPTAEHMAKYLYKIVKKNISKNIKQVGIIESFEDSIAYYSEGKE
jgi:6-pyruvoyltetrahydropterin/6-carboxytetrahydropterin synthase